MHRVDRHVAPLERETLAGRAALHRAVDGRLGGDAHVAHARVVEPHRGHGDHEPLLAQADDRARGHLALRPEMALMM